MIENNVGVGGGVGNGPLQSFGAIEQQPEGLCSDVIGFIFSSLSIQDLVRAEQVCRCWRQIASPIVDQRDQVDQVAMSKYHAFGKEQWEKHYGKVGDVPPAPRGISWILEQPCPEWLGKTVGETHTLFLMPKEVNGKVLSMDYMRDLVQHPIAGTPSEYKFYNPDIHGSVLETKSYWVLMTKTVLEGSRNKSYDQQKSLVKDLGTRAKVEYQLPRAIEAVVQNFAWYESQEERLLSDNPWTYTRCQEVACDRWPLVVGGFASGGLNVYFYHFDNDSYGVGARRKF